MTDCPDASDLIQPQDSVLQTLERLRSRELSAKVLDAAGRQAVVAHLIGEGWSTPEMARLLEVSDRTIGRDRAAVQRQHAPRRDEAAVDRMAGRLQLEADAAISRIRRAARDVGATPRDRIEAERAVWDVLQRWVQLMQSLGYLPRVSQRVTADVTHHTDEAASIERLQEELQELREIDGSEVDEADVHALHQLLRRPHETSEQQQPQENGSSQHGDE